jgi:hypothetical protein
VSSRRFSAGLVLGFAAFSYAPDSPVLAQPRHVAAAAPLTVTQVKVATPTLVIGGAEPSPLFQVGFSGASAGMRYLVVSLTSPSGRQHFGATYQSGLASPSGYVLAGNPSGALSRWAEPGLWTITGITANDWAGDGITLSPAQITALTQGQGVTVVNHNVPDTAPPTIASAKIITPHVTSAAPYFRLSMTVSDDLSGLNTVWINYEGPPGSYTGFGNSFLSPTRSQVASLATNLISPGTYTITLLGACDNAGNCVQYTAPADISRLLGGKTSFVVSQ